MAATRARRCTPPRKQVLTIFLRATDGLRWCTQVHEPDPGHVQQSFYHSIDTPSAAMDVRRPMGCRETDKGGDDAQIP